MGVSAEKEELKIVGMHCATCTTTVERALRRTGALGVWVSLASEEAVVEHEGIPTSKLVEAVRSAGYDVVTYVVAFKIRPVAPEELWLLVSKLEKRKGVVRVEADYATDTLRIEYNPLTTNPEELEEALASWGLKPVRLKEELSTPDVVAARRTLRSYLTRLALGVALAPLTLYAAYTGRPLLALLAAAPVQIYSGMVFHAGALRALRNRVGNMDTLVSLASSIAYLYSVYTVLFMGRPGFVDVAVLLVSFVLVGKTLEAYSKAKMLSGVTSTLPQKAVVLRDGSEVVVDSRTLRVGDLVLLRAGDRSPVDGVVEDGRAEVDEAVITGESRPVVKKKGDPVFSGSTVVSGSITVYSTRTGSKTFFEEVVEATRRAQATKLPIQRTVDRVSALFTPMVLAASLSTFLAWLLLLHAPFERSLAYGVAVLAAACPCALGLATPMAVSLGVRRAAKKGVVVKRGEALEEAHRAQIFVFDKTGTLTEDVPELESYTELVEGAMELAASVESKSRHPYALALVQAFGKRFEPSEFESFTGEGVMGVVEGKTVLVGSKDFIKKNLEDGAAERLDGLEASVYVAVDGRLAGAARFKAKIRRGAKEVVSTLKARGKRVVLVTGDSRHEAKRVADELGIAEVYAETRPEQKAEIVSKLREQGSVLFVGDGINDAQALGRANVGVALGTEVAKAAADVVLVGEDLRALLLLLDESKRVYSKIKQNLAWAFGYNTVILPLAAGLLSETGVVLAPQWAALAMSLSSVLVTLWSRL